MTPDQFSHNALAWLSALSSLIVPLTTFAGGVFGLFAYIKSRANEARLDRQSNRIDKVMIATPAPPTADVALAPPGPTADPAPPPPPPATPTYAEVQQAAEAEMPAPAAPVADSAPVAAPVAQAGTAADAVAVPPPLVADFSLSPIKPTH